MVVHRPLPSFALAVSQIIEASFDEGSQDLTRATSPSSESVDLMKTVDCRTDSVYDNQDDDDDYWRFKQQASSDYEDFCNGYYDDDTDTQTLFDEPMPLAYKLTRQSGHRSSTGDKTNDGVKGDRALRPRAKSLRKVPAVWKSVVRKIARTKTA